MISRRVTLADGVPRWLLISQLEHARLSGVLAEHCLPRFAESATRVAGTKIEHVRQELLSTITHHDDGWRDWESAPPCDPQTRAPLNFNQLPVADSLAIWTKSIQTAKKIGDLAAWSVAGHFSGVFAISEHHRTDPQGAEWLENTTCLRTGWFANWQHRNPAIHTLALAEEALRWLQAFDILSLWPCMSYPVLGERVAEQPQPFDAAEPGWVFRSLRLAPPLTMGTIANEHNAKIAVTPWPFSQREIVLEAAASLVPINSYADAQEVLVAAEPFVARWVLVGG
jgi:hypothetical protein